MTAEASVAVTSATRRLLSLKEAAVYLGVSYWTLRDWVLAGLLPTVTLPPLRPRLGDRQKRSLRRVLVDRQDLDRFIEARKAQTPVEFAS